MSGLAKITAIDYVVLCVILFISICIGFYHGFRARVLNFLKRNRVENNNKKIELKAKENADEANNKETNKTSDYLMANSTMGTIPVAFSLLASFYSATALLGIPAEIYQYGIQYWMISFGLAMCPLIGAFITGPFFASHKVLSIFEYFEMRFESRLVRLVGVWCYLIRNSISCNLPSPTPKKTLFNISVIYVYIYI